MPITILGSPHERLGLAFPYAMVLVFAGLLLFSFSYPPLQDYPEWVYQARLFNALLAQGHSSAFFLKAYPVPYSLSQLILSGLCFLVPPVAASKILVVLYFVSALFITYVLISRFDLDETLAGLFLISTFVVNSCFWNGYIGYQIGLVIYASYLCLKYENKVRAIAIGLFGTATFFTHGLIYVPFCVTAGLYCFYRRKMWSLVLGLTPTLIMLVWYVLANPPSKLGHSLVLDDPIQLVLYKAYTFLKAGPYQDFIISGIGDAQRHMEIHWIGISINVLFVVALFSYFVSATYIRGLGAAFTKPEMTAALILIALMLLLPVNMIGIANAGERLLYPALILACCALLQKEGAIRLSRGVLVAILATGLVVSIVSMASPLLAQALGKSSQSNDHDVLGEHELFSHRLMQFDEKMREAERSWYAGEMPTLPIAFDTGLIGNRKVDR